MQEDLTNWITLKQENAKELVIPLSGNKFTLSDNSSGFIIKGNKNTVKIKTNSNLIQILGNRNEIEIQENNGPISIMGKNNKVVVHKNNNFQIFNKSKENEFYSLDYSPEHEDEILLFNALNSFWGELQEGTLKRIGGQREKEECAICMEEMIDLPTETLECGHRFHRKCIARWLNVKIDCPMCRNKHI